MKTLVVILALTASGMAEILTEKFIMSLNEKQSTWIAGRNFPEDTPLDQLKRLAGTLTPNTTDTPVKVQNFASVAIPEFFDSREAWPQCETIKEIRNQGSCGSCWAFATSETMSDRICVGSNGAQKFKFSPEHLLACCSDCGDCSEGHMEKAFDYYVKSGIVSGGDFDSSEGCQPYDEGAFRHSQTPSCANYCTNSGYGVNYEQDKHYGSTFYWVGTDVETIQTEILTNGPVESYMDIYGDFYNYKSGVYAYTSGENPGGHAVKIIGWGTENGTPYWLVANSWGTGWGGLGGFFKIVRGQNNCRIEQWVYGVTPKL